jgi:hypothetical protein
MIIPNILALDVDGLRCDGMREYCSITPRTVRYAIAINPSRVRKSSCAAFELYAWRRRCPRVAYVGWLSAVRGR